MISDILGTRVTNFVAETETTTMKKLLTTLIILLLFTNYLFSQDKIYKRDGEHIDAKVTEVTNDEIKYKKFTYLDGPTFTISKSEVVMIIYENGEKDIFKEKEREVAETKTAPEWLDKTPNDMYLLGKQDASKKYKGWGPWWACSLSTAAVPIGGVITGICIGTSKVSKIKLERTNPDPEKMMNIDYYKGYTKKIKQKRWGMIWWGIGVGFAADVLTYEILYYR
jgi:hypothetical protein